MTGHLPYGLGLYLLTVNCLSKQVHKVTSQKKYVLNLPRSISQSPVSCCHWFGFTIETLHTRFLDIIVRNTVHTLVIGEAIIPLYRR